jgi:hypothetical protein
VHDSVRNARLAIELEERERRRQDVDLDARFWRRAWVCLMLARTPEHWQALLTGVPCHPRFLDQEWLAHFRKLGLWK